MNYEDPWISESVELENKRFQKKYPSLRRKVLLVGGGGYIGISIAKDMASNGIEVIQLFTEFDAIFAEFQERQQILQIFVKFSKNFLRIL